MRSRRTMAASNPGSAGVSPAKSGAGMNAKVSVHRLVIWCGRAKACLSHNFFPWRFAGGTPALPGALLLALALSACHPKSEAPMGGAGGVAGAAGAPGKRGPNKFPVRTVFVKTQPVTYEIDAVGSLMEQDLFNVPAQVVGVAQKVHFSEGDDVTTGQELCRIDYD